MTRNIEEIWRDLCEKDDRTSPPEYPDMALITQQELIGYLAQARADEAEACAQIAEGGWSHPAVGNCIAAAIRARHAKEKAE